MYDPLAIQIQYVPGVGPKRAEVLEKDLGLRCVGDLLHYYPYKYIDRSRLYQIREIDGTMPYIQLQGEILSFEELGEGRKQRLVAHFTDGTGVVDLVWFQGHFPESAILPGVAQTLLVDRAMREFGLLDAQSPAPSSVKNLKFKMMTFPEETLELRISLGDAPEGRRAKFIWTEFGRPEAVRSTGTLVYASGR